MTMHSHDARAPIVTVHESESLRHAAELMRAEKVGCLVCVDDDGTPVGALTDRDLCLRAVAFARDPDRSIVAGAMTIDFCTAPAGIERERLLGEMCALGVRRILLVNVRNEPVAVTTIDEELRWLSERFADLFGKD